MQTRSRKSATEKSKKTMTKAQEIITLTLDW
jgi:hypothetical protein